MEPRTLDERVAVEIMGCVRVAVTRDGMFGAPPELIADGTLPKDHGRTQLPRYSTDLAGTWQVVEKMRAKGFGFEVNATPADCDTATWCAWFGSIDAPTALASTASEAICLAALAALSPGDGAEG